MSGKTIKVPVPKGMEKHAGILRKLYEKAKKAEKQQ